MRRFLLILSALACMAANAEAYTAWDGVGPWGGDPSHWGGGPWSGEYGPFACDFDSGLCGLVSSSAWASSGGRAVATPTYGPELVTNGTFEAGTTGWITALGSAIATTTTAHAGAAGLSVTRGTNAYSAGGVAVTPALGGFYRGSGYAYNLDATNCGFYLLHPGYVTVGSVTANAYTAMRSMYRSPTANAIGIRLLVNGSQYKSGLFDDISFKRVTAGDQYAGGRAVAGCSVSAQMWCGAGDMGGVYAAGDVSGYPATAIIAYINCTTGNIVMIKRIAGTETVLVNTAKAYSAGAAIEIRRVASDSYQAYYGGAAVGTAQTITGMTGVWYGVFVAGDAVEFDDLEVTR